MTNSDTSSSPRIESKVLDAVDVGHWHEATLLVQQIILKAPPNSMMLNFVEDFLWQSANYINRDSHTVFVLWLAKRYPRDAAEKLIGSFITHWSSPVFHTQNIILTLRCALSMIQLSSKKESSTCTVLRDISDFLSSQEMKTSSLLLTLFYALRFEVSWRMCDFLTAFRMGLCILNDRSQNHAEYILDIEEIRIRTAFASIFAPDVTDFGSILLKMEDVENREDAQSLVKLLICMVSHQYDQAEQILLTDPVFSEHGGQKNIVFRKISLMKALRILRMSKSAKEAFLGASQDTHLALRNLSEEQVLNALEVGVVRGCIDGLGKALHYPTIVGHEHTIVNSDTVSINDLIISISNVRGYL